MQGCGFDTSGAGVAFNASSTYLFFITEVAIPGFLHACMWHSDRWDIC